MLIFKSFLRHESVSYRTTAASDTSLPSSRLSRVSSDNNTNDNNYSSVHCTPVQQSRSSRNPGTSTNGRYTTPNEEFSALFRQGSSRGRAAPSFQRGISHRQAARARTRATSVPYARNSNDRLRKEEIFRTKEVILLPDSNSDKIVRPPEKADLMERGFVLSETKIDKNWSDKEVFQHLDQCFEEKLRNEEYSIMEVGATSISTR